MKKFIPEKHVRDVLTSSDKQSGRAGIDAAYKNDLEQLSGDVNDFVTANNLILGGINQSLNLLNTTSQDHTANLNKLNNRPYPTETLAIDVTENTFFEPNHANKILDITVVASAGGYSLPTSAGSNGDTIVFDINATEEFNLFLNSGDPQNQNIPLGPGKYTFTKRGDRWHPEQQIIRTKDILSTTYTLTQEDMAGNLIRFSANDDVTVTIPQNLENGLYGSCIIQRTANPQNKLSIVGGFGVDIIGNTETENVNQPIYILGIRRNTYIVEGGDPQ